MYKNSFLLSLCYVSNYLSAAYQTCIRYVAQNHLLNSVLACNTYISSWGGRHKEVISLKAKAKVDMEQSISFKYLLMYWTSETCTHSFWCQSSLLSQLLWNKYLTCCFQNSTFSETVCWCWLEENSVPGVTSVPTQSKKTGLWD